MALIVLTLGMGATTAIFSVVDAVALRPLPFDAPEQLVAVGERLPVSGPFSRPPQPGDDPQALRNSTEHSAYDPVGNFDRMIHQAANGGWTRH